MINRIKCRSCKQPYELIWDDSDDWEDDWDDEDDYEEAPENEDPVYCPFCGIHQDYDE